MLPLSERGTGSCVATCLRLYNGERDERDAGNGPPVLILFFLSFFSNRICKFFSPNKHCQGHSCTLVMRLYFEDDANLQKKKMDLWRVKRVPVCLLLLFSDSTPRLLPGALLKSTHPVGGHD
jgi:hypothetical protein